MSSPADALTPAADVGKVLPDVGVAIVHYRSYGDLEALLESLAVFEPVAPVVVVDHASDDDELAAIRLCFPSVRFIGTPDNPGFAAGANRAIRELGTARVLLINPDCLLHGPIVTALSSAMDRHPDLGVIGPRVLNSDGSVQASARRFPDATTALAGRRSWLSAIAPGNALTRRNLMVDSTDDGLRHVDWVSGACMMVSRRAFEAVGGFDEAYFLYWEDADLCRRLRDRGVRTAYDSGVAVTHAGARCSRFNARKALIAFHASALRYFHTHAGRTGRIFVPVVAVLLGGRMMLALAYQAIAGWFTREPQASPATKGRSRYVEEG